MTGAAPEPTASKRAHFITLEGGEGAGKSTQVRLLKTWLEVQGVATLVTREPGGSEQGEVLRTLLVTGDADRWDPLSETLLHYAARREHLRATIRPALARGEWVLCDRFADSTMAYQHFGQGVPAGFIEDLYREVVAADGPSLTLVLEVDPDIGFRRLAARTGDGRRYEDMDAAFHRRVHAGFREIAAAAPERCVLVPAEADQESVQARLRDIVTRRLGVPAHG